MVGIAEEVYPPTTIKQWFALVTRLCESIRIISSGEALVFLPISFSERFHVRVCAVTSPYINQEFGFAECSNCLCFLEC